MREKDELVPYVNTKNEVGHDRLCLVFVTSWCKVSIFEALCAAALDLTLWTIAQAKLYSK